MEALTWTVAEQKAPGSVLIEMAAPQFKPLASLTKILGINVSVAKPIFESVFSGNGTITPHRSGNHPNPAEKWFRYKDTERFITKSPPAASNSAMVWMEQVQMTNDTQYRATGKIAEVAGYPECWCISTIEAVTAIVPAVSTIQVGGSKRSFNHTPENLVLFLVLSNRKTTVVHMQE